MEGNLFSRFKDMEFKEMDYPTTFVPDFLEALKKKQCPMCFHKLYLMRNGRLYYCKAKSCPQKISNGRSFVVNKDKVDRLQ